MDREKLIAFFQVLADAGGVKMVSSIEPFNITELRKLKEGGYIALDGKKGYRDNLEVTLLSKGRRLLG